MTAAAENITDSLTSFADNHEARDWGIEPNDTIDAQFRSDLGLIREAELAAEREAMSLRVF